MLYCDAMLTLDNEKLDKLCKLAKLKILDEEKEQFMSKMNTVLEWIEQLSKIDVSNVEINDLSKDDSTYERSDSPIMNNTKKEILSNTKHKKFDMFCVPKIVE